MRFLAWTGLAALLLCVAAFGCGRAEKGITTLDEAKNAKIGVMIGTLGEAVARARFPRAQVKSFDDIMDAVAALKSGQLEAVVTTYTTALQLLKKNPDLGRLPGDLDREETFIAIRKGNDELLARLNGIIAGLHRDGTLADMRRRWIKEDNSPYQEADIRLPAGGKALKIGVCATREPLSFVDGNGRVSGHDSELARIIGAKLGRPVEFSNMKFMALIPALQSGRIDMIITGMSATDERRKKVDFTQSYFVNSQAMVVRKSGASAAAGATEQRPKISSAAPGAAVISRISDINGKRVAVLTGSAGDLAARRHFPGASFHDMTAAADAALALMAGKIDAFVYDKSVLLNLVRSNSGLVILDEPVDKLEVAAALRKENGRLLADMNRVLQQLKDEGELRRLRTAWVDTHYTTPPALPEVPAAGAGPPLRMGTCANLEPFTFRSADGLTGLDIALCRMIGQRLGRRVEVVDMSFEALIPALQAGKIDFALSNFNVTEERKKLISFSLPYIENDISALVRRSAAMPDGSGESGQGAAASPVPPGRLSSLFSGVAASFQSNIIKEKRYLLLWDGLKTTVVISILSTIFGTLLGALVCFMRMSRHTLLDLPARCYIAILRGTPVLVLLMLIFYVVFASVQVSPVLVAVIAFGMNFAAYVAEIFRSGIEGIDRGQTEAGIALGFTRSATFLHIVLPQMVRRILPVYKGEFISLVKMTSVVGYIAVQDLTKASDIIRSRTFDAFFPLVMVAMLYFLISWLLMQSLGYLERRSDPRGGRGRWAA